MDATDTESEGNQYGTALQAASDPVQLDIFKFLLEHGADPNIRYIHMDSYSEKISKPVRFH
jgi:ankyrin repeat protein